MPGTSRPGRRGPGGHGPVGRCRVGRRPGAAGPAGRPGAARGVAGRRGWRRAGRRPSCRGVPSGASAVVQIDPAPLAALGADAVSVSAGGPPKVGPRARPHGRHAHGAGRRRVVGRGAALPQALSGAAGLLLKMPDDDPVTVVADKDPPALLTTDGAKAGDAIRRADDDQRLRDLVDHRRAVARAATPWRRRPPTLGSYSDVRGPAQRRRRDPPRRRDARGGRGARRRRHRVAGTSWSALATRTGGRRSRRTHRCGGRLRRTWPPRCRPATSSPSRRRRPRRRHSCTSPRRGCA